MLSNPKYPNLELMEYQFKQVLSTDKNWKEKVSKLKEKNKYLCIDFDIIVFSQIWGSTNTAFDVCKNGMPVIGGQAMTRAYTVVIKESMTGIYGVFIDNTLCYIVNNATDEFYKDLSERNMKSFSEASRFY